MGMKLVVGGVYITIYWLCRGPNPDPRAGEGGGPSSGALIRVTGVPGTVAEL